MSARGGGYEQSASIGGQAKASGAIAWWLRIVILLGALLIATGAVIALIHPAMLVSPHDEINGAVQVYAGYLFARNLALALFLVVLLAIGARRALSNIMVLVAIIQILDACMDCIEGRWTIAPGVLIFGIIFFIGAARLCGYPFWRAEAWGE